MVTYTSTKWKHKTVFANWKIAEKKHKTETLWREYYMKNQIISPVWKHFESIIRIKLKMG